MMSDSKITEFASPFGFDTSLRKRVTKVAKGKLQRACKYLGKAFEGFSVYKGKYSKGQYYIVPTSWQESTGIKVEPLAHIIVATDGSIK